MHAPKSGLFLKAALALTLAACHPTSDLTVAPPPPLASVERPLTVPDARTDGRLPDGVRPLRYRLALEVDPKAPRFSGEVTIGLELDRPAAALVLHAAELDLSEAEVITPERRGAATFALRHAAGASLAAAAPEELVVTAPWPIPAGPAELRLKYDAPLTPKLRGLYRVDIDGRSYAFSQLEPSDARRVLPCFDDPIYKTPFEVSVVAPEGSRVFGNATVASTEALADGKTRYSLAPTRPIPTYLLAFAIGPLEQLAGATLPIPLGLVAREGQGKQGTAALVLTEALLAAYGDLLGQPYPYDKLDLVAVPNFGSGAMENAGLITFREELLLVGDKASALARRRSAQVLAHELAHQWFGNLVTMKWWDDLWLNEGMATYFESLILDRLYPDMNAGLEDLSSTGRVMELDALDSARRVRQPVRTTYEAEEAFDGITYVKGAAVLGMLHAYVGDDAFRRGVSSYLARNAFGNAESGALFAALGEASGKDIAGVAASFVDQEGVPVVRANVTCTEAGASVELSQERYRLRARPSPSLTRWKIPVCFRYASKAPLVPRDGALAASEQKRACVLVDGEKKTVPLEACPAYFVPNEGLRGYYRSALGEPDLVHLWKSPTKLDARERVGLVYDSWALMQRGELLPATFLSFFGEWQGEAVRQVVEATLDQLPRIEDALVEAAARPAFERWVARVYGARAKKLGWDAKRGEPEDDKLLRLRVLEALAIHTSDAALLAEAKSRVARYRKNTASIDPDTAGVALRVAARHGFVDKDALVALLKEAKTSEDRTRAVRALGSLSPKAGLSDALSLVLDGTVRSGDFVYLARAAAEWTDSRAVLIAWLIAHLVELAEKTDGLGASNIVGVVARVCDPGERARAGVGLTPILEKIGGSRRRLDEALELADACIDLRKRKAPAASAALTELAK